MELRVKTTRYDPHVELPEPPDYAAMSDEVLVARIRRQDLAACSVYYARHAATIYGRLLALLGDEPAAARALETVFLHVWQRRRELAKLGPRVNQVLMDLATQLALASLGDLPETALAENDDRKALAERCRALGKPDPSDEVIRRGVESILADARPVAPSPSIYHRLSLRLGHPDVDAGLDRYARRWRRQWMIACLAGLAAVVGLAWLIWRAAT